MAFAFEVTAVLLVAPTTCPELSELNLPTRHSRHTRHTRNTPLLLKLPLLLLLQLPGLLPFA